MLKREGMEEVQENLKRGVERSVNKRDVKSKKKLGGKDWWDRDCKKKKRKIKVMYRK